MEPFDEPITLTTQLKLNSQMSSNNTFQVKPAAFLSVYPVEIQRKFLKNSTPISSADKVQTGKVENTKDQIQQYHFLWYSVGILSKEQPAAEF